MIGFLLAAWLAFFPAAIAPAAALPELKRGINDFAEIFPPASFEDLEQRLRRFHTETAHTVTVLTVKSLGGEEIESFAQQAFDRLPLSEAEKRRAILLVVARAERRVALHTGRELRSMLPEPAATDKLLAQAELYWDGMRPDLGVHGAVHYLFRVVHGDVRVGSLTEHEKLEQISLDGREAGAIFALCLGPFLAFFTSMVWGLYATEYGIQRNIRILMGAIFGGATAKIASMFMAIFGGYNEGLWYFIMALAIPLGILGSLTEFWMAGDWRGIPREKERRGRPEDNMGI
jgi:uncharacterized membrane protein YgcG